MRVRALLAAIVGAPIALWVGCADYAVDDSPDAGGDAAVDAIAQGDGDAAAPVDAGDDRVVDAGSADADAGTYCERLAPPTSPADFLCVDFDGPEIAKGWTKTQTDGGVGGAITTAFASPPSSYLVHADARKQVSWQIAGARPVQAFALDVKINPFNVGGVEGWTGEIEIASVRTAQVKLALYLKAGGAIGADWYYENGAAMGGSFTVPSVPANVWTTFTLKSSSAGGNQPALLMNGATIGSTTFGAWNDTAVTVTIGSNPIGATVTKDMRFDDVVATITRK
jgi:hypothetical protein